MNILDQYAKEQAANYGGALAQGASGLSGQVAYAGMNSMSSVPTNETVNSLLTEIIQRSMEMRDLSVRIAVSIAGPEPADDQPKQGGEANLINVLRILNSTLREANYHLNRTNGALAL